MKRNEQTASSSSQSGVVLLESLIAILIFSVGVLAIVGLQATMIKSNSDGRYRSEASYIAQQQIGLIWADPANLPAIPQALNIDAVLPGGTLTITPRPGQQFEVVVTWQQPGQQAHTFITMASIAGG